MSRKIYYKLADICLSCGIDLDDSNWLKQDQRPQKRRLKCKTCIKNKIPKNKEIYEKIRDEARKAHEIIKSTTLFNCSTCNYLLILHDNWTEIDKEKGKYRCCSCKINYAAIKTLNYKTIIQNGYNNICNCCGETGWQFLTIDHILNDGAEERKTLTVTNIKKNIINNNFPTDRYQLLCMNCNYSKGVNGFCAHKIKNTGNNCNFCNCNLNEDNTFQIYIDNNYSICKNCSVTINKKSDSKINNRSFGSKKTSLKLKNDVIKEYGGKCECCGENEFNFLTIDHIFGKNNKEIYVNEVKSGLYTYLRNNNYPKDKYRLLCYNCNCSRGHWGKCYHELNREHNKIITIEDYKQLIMNNLV
jgi:hypothetical protein